MLTLQLSSLYSPFEMHNNHIFWHKRFLKFNEQLGHFWLELMPKSGHISFTVS